MPADGDLGDLNTKNWEDLQGLADSLEAGWKKGQPVDLAQLLPAPGNPTRAIILRELIKTDLECRWRHGQETDLDYYLKTFATDLGPAQSLSPALIYEEYRVRQLFGDRPPLEHFQARFPNQFPDLERLVRENPLPFSPAPGVGAGAASAPLLPSAQLANADAGGHPGHGGHASFGKNIVL